MITAGLLAHPSVNKALAHIHVDAPPTWVWGVLMVGIGVATLVLATYAKGHVHALLPDNMPEQLYSHRLAVLRRGVLACFATGALLVVLGIVTLSAPS